MHNVNMFPRSKPDILINNLSTCKFIKNGVEFKGLKSPGNRIYFSSNIRVYVNEQ